MCPPQSLNMVNVGEASLAAFMGKWGFGSSKVHTVSGEALGRNKMENENEAIDVKEEEGCDETQCKSRFSLILSLVFLNSLI